MKNFPISAVFEKGAALAFLPFLCHAQSYLISTVAGGGVPFTPTSAASVWIGPPTAIATDGRGNAYFIASSYVFKVNAVGILTRVAGISTLGYSGDGGLTTNAQLNVPSGVAVDGAGNVFIADEGSNVVRKVAAATGIITTVAGNGADGYSGDGGAAVSAQLRFPTGVAVDGFGNLYIADFSNEVIRKVAAATGIIRTVAGNSTAGYSGDGGLATSAQLGGPSAVSVDGSGNLYIGDSYNTVVRKVAAATGIISTVAGNGSGGYSGDGGPATSAQLFVAGLTADGCGDIYIADPNHHVIRKVTAGTGIITRVAGNGTAGYAGDGGPATSAELGDPSGVAVDGYGDLYIADFSNYVIRKVAAATGIITTVAGNRTTYYSGDGGPAIGSQLVFPLGVTLDRSGNLYIADSNVVRKVVTATGIITTVAGDGAAGYSGDGGPATNASLNGPFSVAVDGSGNLYIADTQNNAIRKVTAATGIITTVAGNSSAGYTGDGGLAASAQLNLPTGVAVDSAGNLYIADSQNNVIRKVAAATGIITTVAGGGKGSGAGYGGLATGAALNAPSVVTVDGAGNLYIADGFVVRKVTAASGMIATVAGNGFAGYSGDGGPATGATLDAPSGVAVDGAGNLYIADLLGVVIRKVTAATGIITTIAGKSPFFGYSGDGGPATSAELNYPHNLAVDSSGNVYIADGGNFRIRLLVPFGIRALLSVTKTQPAFSHWGRPARLIRCWSATLPTPEQPMVQ